MSTATNRMHESQGPGAAENTSAARGMPSRLARRPDTTISSSTLFRAVRAHHSSSPPKRPRQTWSESPVRPKPRGGRQAASSYVGKVQTPLWQHRRPPKSTARRSSPQPRHRQLSHRPVDFALRAPSARSSAAAAEMASDAWQRTTIWQARRPATRSFHGDWAHPFRHLHRDWLAPATSAPGLGACGERALLRIAGDRASEHARTRGSASARAHTHAHTHAHNTHARTHAHTYALSHTHTHVNMLTHMRTRISHTRARAHTRMRTRMHMRGHRCTHTTYERARTAPMPLTRNCANTRAAHALCFALLCFALRCVGLRGGCAALPTVAQATSPPAPEASDSCAGSPPRPAFAAQRTLDQGLFFRSDAPAFFWVGS